MSQVDQIPDYIEPIVAWRAFLYSPEDWILRSINERIPLTPRVRTRACCAVVGSRFVAGFLGHGTAPEPDCTCGFYAMKNLDGPAWLIRDCMEAGRFHSRCGLISDFCPALSQVYLWGKMIEHELGYRAEFCYPKTILAWGKEDTRRLAYTYRCQGEPLCKWVELFGSSELSLYESWSAMFSPSPAPLTYGGISRNNQYVQRLATPKERKPEPLKSPNRSVAKPLQAAVEHKEEVAKSDFWKQI